jgi:hypothetical protein
VEDIEIATVYVGRALSEGVDHGTEVPSRRVAAASGRPFTHSRSAVIGAERRVISRARAMVNRHSKLRQTVSRFAWTSSREQPTRRRCHLILARCGPEFPIEAGIRLGHR